MGAGSFSIRDCGTGTFTYVIPARGNLVPAVHRPRRRRARHIVTWTLEDSGGGARLQLVHSGFGDNADTEDFRTGWLKHIIWMKAAIEKGATWSAPELVSADWDEL